MQISSNCGEEAKNGIVYLFTKDYVRTKYWNLFRAISAPFAKAVKSPGDVHVVYILNDKILTEKTEADLFLVTKDNLIDIQVIEKAQLKNQFGKNGRIGERLREFPGLENLSDQEAKQVIDSLKKVVSDHFLSSTEIPCLNDCAHH